MLLSPQSPDTFPLVLDLDGTLLHTDTFHEMVAILLLKKSFILLWLPFWFLKGRSYAKAQLVKYANVNLEILPYNSELLSLAKNEAMKGRSLILATGTNQKLAQKISDHFGFFKETIGSEENKNLTGLHKRKALIDRFGNQGFDYAGDSSIDVVVWEAARKAFVVCPKWGVLKTVQALKSSENIHYFPRNKLRFVSFFVALRPLFWLLNVLSSNIIYFLLFSLLSSGLLIAGDIFSLEKERKKGRKIKSIFAKGELHLTTAFMLVPLLFFPCLFIIWSIGDMIFFAIWASIFSSLDYLTRCIASPLRWTLLSLLQIVTLLGMNIMPVYLFPPL